MDDIFIIKSTDYNLSPKELIIQYKNLAKAERAFNEIKDFLRIRPIRYYQDNRVRAHVFICVLSYPLEKILQKKKDKAHFDITPREALDKLNDIRITKIKHDQRFFFVHYRKILGTEKY